MSFSCCRESFFLMSCNQEENKSMAMTLFYFTTGFFFQIIPKKAAELLFILIPSQSSSLIFQKHIEKLFFIPAVWFYDFSWGTLAPTWSCMWQLQNFLFHFLGGEGDDAVWRISHLALSNLQLALRAISCSSCICARFVSVISLCSLACQRAVTFQWACSPHCEDWHVCSLLQSLIWQTLLYNQRSRACA